MAVCNDPAVPAQLSGVGIGLSRRFHLQRLVRPLLVVKLDPVANHPTGMLQGLEPLPMGTLLLERSYHPLDHAVLFRRVRRDELLLQAIALHQGRVVATGKHQPIVAT